MVRLPLIRVRQSVRSSATQTLLASKTTAKIPIAPRFGDLAESWQKDYKVQNEPPNGYEVGRCRIRPGLRRHPGSLPPTWLCISPLEWPSPWPRVAAFVMHRREKMSGKLTLGHRNKVSGNSPGEAHTTHPPRYPAVGGQGHHAPVRASETPGQWMVQSLVSLTRGTAAVHDALRTYNNTLCTELAHHVT